MQLFILLFLFIAGVLLELKYKVRLFTSIKQRFATVGVTFLVIILWELVNRHIYKAWTYPGSGMVGLNFFGLPLELYVFAIVAPYFSFIVYELLHEADISADR